MTSQTRFSGVVGFAGWETTPSQRRIAANTTTLSGNIAGGDAAGASYHVLAWLSATDAIVDGFTVTAGNANGADANGGGGGVAYYGTGVVLCNCTIAGNSAVAGGGIAAVGPGNLTLIGCTISANTAAIWGGGGVYAAGIGITHSRCTITGNTAEMGAALLLVEGGSVVGSDSIYDSNVANNLGGCFCEWYGTGEIGGGGTFTRCLFSRNTARHGSLGLTNLTGDFVFDRCTVVQNVATDLLHNETFAFNVAAATGSLTIINTIWRDNTTKDGDDAGLYEITGNLSNNVYMRYCAVWDDWDAFVAAPTVVLTSGDCWKDDPAFMDDTDLDGPDNLWKTADDGLRLGPSSPFLKAGEKAGRRWLGGTSFSGEAVALGAYQ